tara:strand:+ start:357 stop:521 length:165 start_codon:yes stop_codon:yes gene_type:complete
MTYKQIYDKRLDGPLPDIIKRKADGAFIPFDDNNRDYVSYKEWLAAGNTPEAPD